MFDIRVPTTIPVPAVTCIRRVSNFFWLLYMSTVAACLVELELPGYISTSLHKSAKYKFSAKKKEEQQD